jgi:uncharacterized membrane protein YgcG
MTAAFDSRQVSPAGRRSWVARHGAGLVAGATTLILLAIATAFLPRRPIEALPAPPAHWFDDRAKLVSSGYAAGKSEYLQQYLPIVLHASVLIITEQRAPTGGIEGYTASAANSWRIGAKGADNGVALFVFRDERTIRMEVGYGLEGALPDIEAKHLVEATLVPKFTAGQYEEGFDDFISALQDKLKSYSEESGRSSTAVGLIEYVVAVLRQAPRVARLVWAAFSHADLGGRVVLTLFATVFAALAGYALSAIVGGLIAIAQLPWRMATGTAIRSLSRERLAAEFSPAEFAKRPPPSLLAVAEELRFGTIAWSVLWTAMLVVCVAFVGLGTEVFIGERGQFSGAGITTVWPNR